MNTPRGAPSLNMNGPRTPRTPTVSTSFFFSDVAGLPRSGDFSSPKAGGEAGKRGNQRGYSNIICISPLASSKNKNGSSHQVNTPINYKDVFASPADKARSLPMLGDSPTKGMKARGLQRSSSRDPSLDAVHMAERDLMEDEDLSVLLQLASNTPRPMGERASTVSTSDGTHVFRSPDRRNASGGSDENLPALQLPVIGGGEVEGTAARLSRKTHSRDHNENPNDFKPSSLGMRPNSPGQSKAIYLGKAKAGKPSIKKEDMESDDKRKANFKGEPPKKFSKMSSMHPGPSAYSMPPPHYLHPGADIPPYYPMPPGMPPGGSMRVVVGGPPPPRPPNSGSPHRTGSPHAPRPYAMGPGDGPYPYPPPPPGHYAPYPGGPPSHMGPPQHPHYSHYPPAPHHTQPPPRPHMPMYGAQHPPSIHPPPIKGKPSRKSKPTAKTKLAKRPPLPPPPPQVPLTKSSGSAKKQKKLPATAIAKSPASAPKKKNRSPQITDKGERQKSAAAIQAVNAASGGKNDRAAALAAAILRGVTMRPSGKWVSCFDANNEIRASSCTLSNTFIHDPHFLLNTASTTLFCGQVSLHWCF
jgi:hypothetical protein